MNARYGATIIGCAVFAVTSCKGRPEPRASQTVITSARMIMNDDAAMKLTTARCERESACDHVGATRRFSDAEVRQRSLFSEAQAVVRPEACPVGVDEAKLSPCLAALRSEAKRKT